MPGLLLANTPGTKQQPEILPVHFAIGIEVPGLTHRPRSPSNEQDPEVTTVNPSINKDVGDALA